MLHLLQSGKAPQERQELAELEDEALERLRFLVDRKACLPLFLQGQQLTLDILLHRMLKPGSF